MKTVFTVRNHAFSAQTICRRRIRNGCTVRRLAGIRCGAGGIAVGDAFRCSGIQVKIGCARFHFACTGFAFCFRCIGNLRAVRCCSRGGTTCAFGVGFAAGLGGIQVKARFAFRDGAFPFHT